MIKLDDKCPIRITRIFGSLVLFSAMMILFSFITIIVYSSIFENPTELQMATYDTCNTVFFSGMTGLIGLVTGKLST